MCRWIVYFGNEVPVSDAIAIHGHGLVEVASAPVYAPGLTEEHLYSRKDIQVNFNENGDGFGVGFYPNDKSLLFPGVLRDCKPIWHSNNLLPIAEAIKTPLVFGHVRKTSSKGSLAEQNCHPFKHGVYLFMHNGVIHKFHKIRASLLQLISDIFDSVSKDHDMEDEIMGTTDTEVLFFLILACVARMTGSIDFSKRNCTVKQLYKCMQEAIIMVLDLVNTIVGRVGPGCRLNLALADGDKIVVTRFRNAMENPPSLYYTLRQRNAKTLRSEKVLSLDDDLKDDDLGLDLCMSETFGFSQTLLPQCVMIASEPTNKKEENLWKLLPRNHVMMVTRAETGALIVESENMDIASSYFQVPNENVCAFEK